jgi:hypothetical protein
MGHKSIVTTMRYAHLAPQHKTDAVEKLVNLSSKSSSGTTTSTRVKKNRQVTPVSLR